MKNWDQCITTRETAVRSQKALRARFLLTSNFWDLVSIVASRRQTLALAHASACRAETCLGARRPAKPRESQARDRAARRRLALALRSLQQFDKFPGRHD